LTLLSINDIKGIQTIFHSKKKYVLPDWYWATDTIENIDEDVIDEIKEFNLNLIKKIDTPPSS
jgi:hypothetical protein